MDINEYESLPRITGQCMHICTDGLHICLHVVKNLIVVAVDVIVVLVVIARRSRQYTRRYRLHCRHSGRPVWG